MIILESLRKAGFRFNAHRGDVGIEIETESKIPYDPPQMKFWNAVRDGSLRDWGWEYILQAPVSNGGELKAALEEFRDKTSKFNLTQDSVSTSVHVHINFLHNKWIELANFLTLYYLLENLLVKFSGPDRLSNLFCLPACDAEASVDAAVEMVSNIGKFAHRRVTLPPDNFKYAALNLCNLSRLGTLEVRTMRGVTDISLIQQWVDILLTIKTFCMQEGLKPTDILELYHKEEHELLWTVFPRNLGNLINDPRKDELIRKNLWFAKRIACASKFDVETWGFPKPKKIVREKLTEALNQVAQEMFETPFKELNYVHKLVVEERVANSLGIEPRVVFLDGDE